MRVTNPRYIYKFALAPLDDYVAVSMPRGAQLLTVQTQAQPDGDAPFIWAAVDPSEPAVIRTFRVAGTGHPLRLPVDTAVPYVGTFQLIGGRLVFHVFDLGESFAFDQVAP